MLDTPLREMPVADLVERFAANCIEQDRAELLGDTQRFRPLVFELRDIQEELQRRHGDQRRVLAALFEHPNFEVRLNAAKATLGIAPLDARRVLREISDPRVYLQAAEASVTLKAVEDESFKPI